MCERAIDYYKSPYNVQSMEVSGVSKKLFLVYFPLYSEHSSICRSSLKPTTVRIKTTSRPALPSHSAQTNLLPQHS
jgi:hypothetical protein